jgi:hypothetical protein
VNGECHSSSDCRFELLSSVAFIMRVQGETNSARKSAVRVLGCPSKARIESFVVELAEKNDGTIKAEVSYSYVHHFYNFNDERLSFHQSI